MRSASFVTMLLVALLVASCSNPSSSEGSSTTTAVQGGIALALHGGRSKSDVRAVIDTSIGGGSQSLLFDSGSVGISVLSNAVPSNIAQLTGPSFQEPFDDGVVMTGVVVNVVVSLSGQSTAGPIAIRLVQSVTCESQTPDCAAKNGMSSFSKSIGADGIFGAGLWSTGTVFSALLQLASGPPTTVAVQWNGSTGSVTLDGAVSQSPAVKLQMPASSPATFPDGSPAWSNQSVPMCWQIATGAQTCTPTILDTGASALSFPIDYPGGPTTNVKELPHGQTITAAGSAGASPFLTFKTGGTLGTDLVTVIPGQSSVDSGIGFFRTFIVVFSMADGTVELFTP